MSVCKNYFISLYGLKLLNPTTGALSGPTGSVDREVMKEEKWYKRLRGELTSTADRCESLKLQIIIIYWQSALHMKLPNEFYTFFPVKLLVFFIPLSDNPQVFSSIEAFVCLSSHSHRIITTGFGLLWSWSVVEITLCIHPGAVPFWVCGLEILTKSF